MKLDASIYIIFSACDKACDGCIADGPDTCNKCAEGYTLKDGICQGNVKIYLVFTGYGFTLLSCTNICNNALVVKALKHGHKTGKGTHYAT
jgi:hypothetical protein